MAFALEQRWENQSHENEIGQNLLSKQPPDRRSIKEIPRNLGGFQDSTTSWLKVIHEKIYRKLDKENTNSLLLPYKKLFHIFPRRSFFVIKKSIKDIRNFLFSSVWKKMWRNVSTVVLSVKGVEEHHRNTENFALLGNPDIRSGKWFWT